MRNSIWLGAVLATALAACATMSDVRGNLPDEERLARQFPVYDALYAYAQLHQNEGDLGIERI